MHMQSYSKCADKIQHRYIQKKAEELRMERWCTVNVIDSIKKENKK